ncbi:hypothetical protein GCM10011409_18760 [Lentibacillus populi]|uniref:Uncharacterized protein n=1 Tax=Lentibacillus populi TaxID=1827502 RepID=A0A9W5TX01_9BACI|nr:hypothetical protein [Lentibacillus populi]GGB41487.1 hypothetical protein GCM10011409_18760 [Lentibacillus populi]
MDYLKQAKNEIRKEWFSNHEIKLIEGSKGFQRINWGEQGSRMYQIDYVLSDNMVFVSGDLGTAAYELTCAATLENIKDFNLSYFTGKLSAHERRRWDFDPYLAKEEIEEYIFDWCDISHVDQLSEEDNELYEELIGATQNWDLQDHFEKAVFSIYENTSVGWFDGEAASCISDCGKRLPRSLIAYWVGLQMVIEQLEKKEGRSVNRGSIKV